MENERIVYNPVGVGPNAGGDNGTNMGGGLWPIILLALLGGRGRGGLLGGGDGCCENPGDGIAAKVVALQNSADLKSEIKDVESGLRETLLNQTIGLNNEFRSIDGKICDVNMNAVKCALEAKISVLEATNQIKDKVCDVEQMVKDVKCALEDKISTTTQLVLDRLSLDKLDSKNDEIQRLRDANRQHEQNAVFANQFAAVNALLSTVVQQNQHLTNKVVQFGTGNTAVPVATNNQVG